MALNQSQKRHRDIQHLIVLHPKGNVMKCVRDGPESVPKRDRAMSSILLHATESLMRCVRDGPESVPKRDRAMSSVL